MGVGTAILTVMGLSIAWGAIRITYNIGHWLVAAAIGSLRAKHARASKKPTAAPAVKPTVAPRRAPKTLAKAATAKTAAPKTAAPQPAQAAAPVAAAAAPPAVSQPQHDPDFPPDAEPLPDVDFPADVEPEPEENAAGIKIVAPANPAWKQPRPELSASEKARDARQQAIAVAREREKALKIHFKDLQKFAAREQDRAKLAGLVGAVDQFVKAAMELAGNDWSKAAQRLAETSNPRRIQERLTNLYDIGHLARAEQRLAALGYGDGVEDRILEDLSKAGHPLLIKSADTLGRWENWLSGTRADRKRGALKTVRIINEPIGENEEGHEIYTLNTLQEPIRAHIAEALKQKQKMAGGYDTTTPVREMPGYWRGHVFERGFWKGPAPLAHLNPRPVISHAARLAQRFYARASQHLPKFG